MYFLYINSFAFKYESTVTLVYRVVSYQMFVSYQMHTWVTSDRSAAWNWAPRVGRMTWVTTFRFFLVGSSSSLSSTLPPASLPPALYDRNNWSIVHVHVCGVKKKSASNTQYMYWLGVVTMICLANQVPVLNNSHKNSLSL